MEKRGGGILDIELRDKTDDIENYYQLHATFETLDAMGANFINSCLEQFSSTLKHEAENYSGFENDEKDIQVVMIFITTSCSPTVITEDYQDHLARPAAAWSSLRVCDCS